MASRSQRDAARAAAANEARKRRLALLRAASRAAKDQRRRIAQLAFRPEDPDPRRV